MVSVLLASRPLGLGAGLFTLLVFVLLSILGCLYGANTRRPWPYYLVSTAATTIVFLILILSPREGESSASETAVFNQSLPATIGVFVAATAAAVAGGVFYFVHHVFRQRVAQRR